MERGTNESNTENNSVDNGELTVKSQVEPEVKYAGFWIRFAALLLDIIVLTAISLILRVAIGVDLVNPPAGVALLETGISIAYYVVLTVMLGQTLGKMALGIEVVRQDGKPISWGWILLRETIGKLVSMFILFIGFIMAAFDSKKRALHDRMSNTYVIKVEKGS
jgi:uncharacterized RDD family membrane protein YckC